jgi:hypothetical protein
MEVNLCFFLKKNVIGYIFSEYSLFSVCNSELSSCHTKKTIDLMQPKRRPDRALSLQMIPAMLIRHPFLSIFEPFIFSVVVPGNHRPSAGTRLQFGYLLFLKN